jgi:hypothetical protein
MSPGRRHSRPTCRCRPHFGNHRVRAARHYVVVPTRTIACRCVMGSVFTTSRAMLMVASRDTGWTRQTSPASGAQINPHRAQCVATRARCPA